ncbi:hypothetical protein HanLR1_Chr00c3255g0871821 [Helianthus annuus]|nr:hypothetical protein HanLR1_Chr00c3255g0871821 [Helianthus annuus]
MVLSVALHIKPLLILYCLYRRRSRSISPRRHRKSPSPVPRRHKRQKSRSTSLSPVAKSPSIGPTERKIVTVKTKIEDEEQKKRYITSQIFLSSLF